MKIELEDADVQLIAERVGLVLRADVDKAKVTQMEPLLDTQGVAHYIGVDTSWINKAVSEKRIPYIKIGKYNKFRKSTIDVWIEQNTVKPIKGSEGISEYRPRRKNVRKA